MRLQKWEAVLLILAAVSLAILGLAYTVGARATSREGAVSRIARPGVAFWGQRVDVEVRINAGDLPACPTTGDLEPIYAALVIDHSGSMAGIPLQEARNAASDFVQLMNLGKGNDSVSVVMFSDSANLLSSFSYDWGQVVRAIQSIPDGGGTDVAAGLALGAQQFGINPPPTTARKVLILLSDGQSDAAAAIAAGDHAKAQGIRVVTIALGDADRPTLARIASSEADYYETADPGTLLEIYGEIAAGMVGTAATDVTLTETWNDARFNLIDAGLYRAQQTGNQIVWQLPFIGQRGRSVGYFLQPRTPGWLKVSPVAGQLSLTDCNAQPLSQATAQGPRVLVIFPAWFLYIFPALAVLWAIARLVKALRPPPRIEAQRPGPRADLAPVAKPIKKEEKSGSAADVTHGRPSKPAKRQ